MSGKGVLSWGGAADHASYPPQQVSHSGMKEDRARCRGVRMATMMAAAGPACREAVKISQQQQPGSTADGHIECLLDPTWPCDTGFPGHWGQALHAAVQSSCSSSSSSSTKQLHPTTSQQQKRGPEKTTEEADQDHTTWTTPPPACPETDRPSPCTDPASSPPMPRGTRTDPGHALTQTQHAR